MTFRVHLKNDRLGDEFEAVGEIYSHDVEVLRDAVRTFSHAIEAIGGPRAKPEPSIDLRYDTENLKWAPPS